MRKLKGNAIRDDAEGKISYYGFRHPMVEHSFGKYMMGHQKCADGTTRSAKNWWDGWSEDVSIDSLVRHVEDLTAIDSGSFVYKKRLEGKGEETILSDKPLNYKNLRLVTKEECYNAARFNLASGLLEYLRNENEK